MWREGVEGIKKEQHDGRGRHKRAEAAAAGLGGLSTEGRPWRWRDSVWEG